MIVVKADVLFAAPNHLDGLAELLRKQGGFDDIIGLRLTAESAAQQGDVADDVFLLDAERRGHGLLHGLRILGGAPAGELAVTEVGEGDGRLHRRVGQHGHVVFGFVGLGGFGKSGIDVAHVADHLLRFARRVLQGLLEGLGVKGGVGAALPFHLQFLAALHGGVSGVGDDGHAAQGLKGMRGRKAIQHHGAFDAFHLLGGGIIEALQLAAIDGRTLDGGVDHAGHVRIHAEGALTGDDVVLVDDRNVFADVAVFGDGLVSELAFGRDRLLGSQGDQFAEARLLAGLGVDHFVIARLHLTRRHAPFGGGGALEHHARGGAGVFDGLDKVADGAGAIGVLRTVFGVAQRLFYLDALPVGFQFLGEHQRQGGADAGAHLGAVGHNGDEPIGGDADEDVGHPGLGRLGGFGERRGAQNQRTGGEHLA